MKIAKVQIDTTASYDTATFVPSPATSDLQLGLAENTIAPGRPLQDKFGEIAPARSISAQICDFLFSQAEKDYLLFAPRINPAANNSLDKSPGTGTEETLKTSPNLLDNILRQINILSQVYLPTVTVRDTALQQVSHDDWLGDWQWNVDWNPKKKLEKANLQRVLPDALFSILKR